MLDTFCAHPGERTGKDICERSVGSRDHASRLALSCRQQVYRFNLDIIQYFFCSICVDTGRASAVIETQHPYPNNAQIYQEVHFPQAIAIVVTFDEQVCRRNRKSSLLLQNGSMGILYVLAFPIFSFPLDVGDRPRRNPPSILSVCIRTRTTKSTGVSTNIVGALVEARKNSQVIIHFTAGRVSSNSNGSHYLFFSG